MEIEHKPKSTIVIFGVTGDLAQRKLFPALFKLYQQGKIGEEFAVVGAARSPWTDQILRENVEKSIVDDAISQTEIDRFISHFYYLPFDVTDTSSYHHLDTLINDLEEQYHTDGNRLFYLAMAPQFFGVIASNLNIQGLKTEPGWNRLVIEKPFGHDLPTAKILNKEIREAFHEKEIYRIDHYLGKEMVQNIEVIRFANGIFEHLWNNRFISNIQVTSSESLGVEERATYYDHSGAMRDMVQNHMLQMVSLLAMEPPINLTTDEIRSEKIKVLRAIRKADQGKLDKHFVRGQYGSGEIDGIPVPSYRDEHDELATSNTETFVAGRIMIDSYRWAGVPFYIRTGKRMTEKSTQIVVEFKDIPMKLYYENKDNKHPNLLVINIQPNEGVTLHLNAKKAGSSNVAVPIQLSHSNHGIHSVASPDAYEKLLFDCMVGDGTNFTHWDEVALAWELVDSVLNVWENDPTEIPNYKSGSMGPDASDELLEQDGFHWWPIEDYY